MCKKRKLKNENFEGGMYPGACFERDDAFYSRLKSFQKLLLEQKKLCGFVVFKRKIVRFVDFIKNEGVDENENQNCIGSKLIVTWSESIRSDGLTIFENEAVIKFSALAFYSKMITLTHTFSHFD